VEKVRIHVLEGIRGYAVALVFLVHFFAHYFNGTTSPIRIDFDNYQPGHPAGWIAAVAHYFWASHYGVDLFFLLSGFLIAKIISRQDFSYLGFLHKRILRLYPAFLLALIAHLIYMAVFWNKTFDWPTIASNLLFLHGIWELRIEPVIVPTWSLTYEWLFYLVFPAVLLLPYARRRLSPVHIAMCAAAVLVLVAPLGGGYMRFLMFLLGAAFGVANPQALGRLVARVPDALVIAVYIAANLLFVADQEWYRFIPVYLVTSALLVAKVVYGTGMLHRAFACSPLRRLGNISYSFYLLHGLAIVAFCDHVGPLLLALPEPGRFVLLFAGSFVSSMAAGWLSYWVMERPYFARQHAAARAADDRDRGDPLTALAAPAHVAR
jgi:exopolysaccharide production protein ExoZ